MDESNESNELNGPTEPLDQVPTLTEIALSWAVGHIIMLGGQPSVMLSIIAELGQGHYPAPGEEAEAAYRVLQRALVDQARSASGLLPESKKQEILQDCQEKFGLSEFEMARLKRTFQ